MDADGYVDLAVQANGPLPPKSERGAGYVWGYALEVCLYSEHTRYKWCGEYCHNIFYLN